jgi:zinc protease
MRILKPFAVTALALLWLPVVAGSTLEPSTITLREAESPFIAFNLWIKSGSAADPKGKEGLAAMTASMIADGATSQDSVEQILEKLYPMSAGYDAAVDKEMTNLVGRVHRDNLEAYYTLIKNALLSPAFAAADFDRLKAQRLNFLERGRRYARDEELSKDLLFWMAYQGTPYAHPPDGYVDSVKSITLDDVRAFYREHYTRDNVVVGLGGGYPSGFAERVRKDLDALPASTSSPATRAPQKAVAPAAPAGIKMLLVEKETDASAISFGYPISLLRNQPDFIPLLIANSYLGEHRNAVGRLYQAIRETRGMNYGNYSYIEAFPAGYATQQPRVNVPRRSQLFEIWIRPISLTAPGNLHERTLFATRAALFELKKLADAGMTPEAVHTSKEFLRNYAGTWGATISRRLGYAIDDAFYGMAEPGFLQSAKAAIDKASVEQVNAAVKKHLQADNLYLVIITADAAGLKQKLLTGQATSITYAGDRPAALLAEDKMIAALPISVKEGDITILPIDQVFQ